MRNFDRPLVPISYLVRLVAIVEQRNVDTGTLLRAAGLSAERLAAPHGTLPLAELGHFAERAANATPDPAIGLELGFALKASSHGMVGFALMTCNSLRDAIELGARIIGMVSCPWQIQLVEDRGTAIIRFHDVLPARMPGRDQLLEAGLAGAVGLSEYAIGESVANDAIEIWCTWAERAYYARFRERIPRMRYEMPTTEARFPASWLDRPLALREPVANREVMTALERDRRMLSLDEDLVKRARALVSDPAHEFPDLEGAARMLRVSARTLRRRLNERGLTYQALRDEARRAHAPVLLEQTTITVEEIAHALGYAGAAVFVRAFQRWTGMTPAAARSSVARRAAS